MSGRIYKKEKLSQLLAWSISIPGLVPVLGFAANPSNSQETQVLQPVVPADFRSFISQDESVLAYKALESPGDGSVIAVIITRDKNSSSADDQANPCQMTIFNKTDGVLSIAGKSKTIVDCQYNDLARRSKNLNENLEINTKEITYIDPQIRANDRYTFRFSHKEKTWYLYKVLITYAKLNTKNQKMITVKNTVTYPDSINWMPIEKFDIN